MGRRRGEIAFFFVGLLLGGLIAICLFFRGDIADSFCRYLFSAWKETGNYLTRWALPALVIPNFMVNFSRTIVNWWPLDSFSLSAQKLEYSKEFDICLSGSSSRKWETEKKRACLNLKYFRAKEEKKCFKRCIVTLVILSVLMSVGIDNYLGFIPLFAGWPYVFLFRKLKKQIDSQKASLENLWKKQKEILDREEDSAGYADF